MGIPDYQACMLPLLRTLADGQTRTMREVLAAVSDHFQLSEAEREQLLPSGQTTVMRSRVGWAKTYLKNAGLIDNSVRGRVSISELGRCVLAENPAGINTQFLEQFEGYREFIERSAKGANREDDPEVRVRPAPPDTIATPTEQLTAAYNALKEATKSDLLARLKQSSPAFFEKAVVRLLEQMGYGLPGEGQITGRPGDGGIDGVIREDKLGLDVVCIQAKRWEGTVGRPKVQEFVGSMDLERARKGVIITTPDFTFDAKDFVKRIEGKKVVLIDGVRLVDLMFEHDTGVATVETLRVKEVSNDFFDEESE